MTDYLGDWLESGIFAGRKTKNHHKSRNISSLSRDLGEVRCKFATKNIKMKCEFIIEGLEDREQFWAYCWESDTCVKWHDGTIHAIYYSKQCAREEAKILKSYYPNIKTKIGTDFDGWLVISNRLLRHRYNRIYSNKET